MCTSDVTRANSVAGFAYFVGLGLGEGEGDGLGEGEGDGLGPGAVLSTSTTKTSVAFGGMITAPVCGLVWPAAL